MTWLSNEKLRPCNRCKGPLGPSFLIHTTRLAVIDPQRAHQHMGLAMMLGGSETLANTMGSGACYEIQDEVLEERFVCMKCSGDVSDEQ